MKNSNPTYITREIEATIDAKLKQGKVLLLTGARQVGKTTTLKQHLGSNFSYVSMDDARQRALASQDSALFFSEKTLPLIIDEIQRAPELFLPVKLIADQSSKKGQIILTGSQTYHLMKGVSESLAGRVRILQMPPLCLRELLGRADNPHPYVPKKINPMPATEAATKEATVQETAKKTTTHEAPIQKSSSQKPSNFNLWETIHIGSMPELNENQDFDDLTYWDSFYSDYVATYLERDVRDLINVKDEVKFYNFMVACAARTGQLFNASEVAGAIGTDHKTAQSWLSVLQASNIVHVLEPFWPNVNKRLTKMPKIYFLDTGLACHLTRWTTPDQLKNGAAAGQMFETFVVSEILKSYMNAGANLRDVWFYRDSRKHEIDIVIQHGHVLHPVEVKTAATVGESAIKNFAYLEGLGDYKVGFGHVICQTNEPYLISKNVQAVPVWTI